MKILLDLFHSGSALEPGNLTPGLAHFVSCARSYRKFPQGSKRFSPILYASYAPVLPAYAYPGLLAWQATADRRLK